MKKKVTTRKIAKKAKEVKKKPETTLKTTEKTVTKKKEPKKAKTKEKKTTAKKVIAKIEEKPKKVIKKIIAEIEKKPEKVVKKVVAKIKKKLKKVAKKLEVKKKEIVKLEKKPKKVAKKVVAKIKKKIPLKPEKKVEIKKITKKPKKKVEVKKKEVKAKIKEKPEKVAKKVELKKPVIEEKYPPTPWEALPAEYGENSVTLMTVDPNKLFTYWEVREDTLAMYEGNLNVRVYDVTGVEFDGTNANIYVDIAVSERIGRRYIDVSPEKEFITDIGIINPTGIFITIARSNKVSTPRITISEEVVLPQKLYETGFRVGY